MADTLYPLKFPPGIYRNGTKTQSTGRWYDGNLIRFHQGTIQPVGGWVQRAPPTGDPLTGIPNNALLWTTDEGNEYLLIGTTTGLFVLDQFNDITDITPAGFDPDGNVPFWSFDLFGSYAVCSYNGAGTNPAGDVNVYVWKGAVGVPAEAVGEILFAPVAPTEGFGVVVTPERFLFMLRGHDFKTLSAGLDVAYRASRGGAISADVVP